MIKKLHYIIFGLFFMLPLTVSALAPEWQVIPNESKLTFSGTQNDSPVTAEFKTFTGKIFVDFNDLPTSNLDIQVDMNSLSASYAELKTTLMTADWFNVKIFPKAEFKSNQIVKKGDGYQAVGTLTIRDKSLPVTLTFSVTPLDPDKVKVKGSTVIKRTLFGIGQGDWANTKEVKDEVTVNFEVTAKKISKV